MTSIASALEDGAQSFSSPGPIVGNSRNASPGAVLPTNIVALFVQMGKSFSALAASSATRIRDPWVNIEHSRTTSNGHMLQHQLLINALGWSLQEAADVRLRLLPFEEDWDAPGMDVYDAL